MRILGRLAIIEDQVKSPEKSDQNRVGTRSQKKTTAESEDFKEAPVTRDKDENDKNVRFKHQLPNSGVDNTMNLMTSKLCQCTKHIHPNTTA